MFAPRVGAMPQPKDGDNNKQRSTKSSKGGNTGGRSKGITMEDLKRQTAIRLAKEHNANGVVGGFSDGTEPLYSSSYPSGAASSRQNHPGPTTFGAAFSQGNIRPQAPSIYPPQPNSSGGYYNPPHIGAPPPQPYYHHSGDATSYAVPNGSGGAGTGGPYRYSTTPSPQPMQQNRYHSYHQPPGPTPPPTQSAQLSHQNRPRSNGPSPQPTGYVSTPSQLTVATASGLQPLGSVPSSLSDSSSGKGSGSGNNGNNTNPAKNKLPHGLTVHELKEMTKARLQAEAAEKPEAGSDVLTQERSFGGASVDMPITGHHLSNPPPPQHPQGQMNASNGAAVGRHIQPSPLTAPGAPTYRTITQRSDTWESASVASYNSTAGLSENFGTESVSDVGSYAGNRTRSFTYPAVQPHPEQETIGSNLNLSRETYSNPPSAHASPSRPGFGLSHGQSSFDAAVGGGNRRRAVTLSPNTGSILEDRPHHFGSTVGTDNLIIPSFSSTGSGEGGSLTTTRHRDYSPVLEQLGLGSGLDSSFLGNQSIDSVASGGGVLSDGFRRSTGTAVTSTLPGVSQIAATTPERNSLNDLPTTRASGAHSRVPAPPPGFVSASDSLFHAGSTRTAFSRVGSVESIPETFPKDRLNQWDSQSHNPARPHFASVENLASDMGSLLNLSTDSSLGRPDRGRANTYTFGVSGASSGSSFFSSLPDDGCGGSSEKDPFRHL